MGATMSLCRHCGRKTGLNDTPYTVCDACANSPLCDGCGHERRDHDNVFVDGGEPGCRARVGDFQALDLSPCPCEGFRPVEGALSDAAFVQPDPDPFEGPPLRLA